MFISNLQIARAFAAIWVVIFHTIFVVKQYGQGSSSLINLLGSKGYFGVDIFFVISGFVIFSASYRKLDQGGLTFFKHRCQRIVPPYLLLTVIYVILKMIFPDFFMEKEATTIGHFLSSIFYVSFANFHRPEMIVGWTLEFEMLFYTLVALIIALRKQVFAHVPNIMSLLVIAGYAYGLVFPPNRIVTFLSNPLILEFALGFLIAQYLLAKTINKTGLLFVACALGVTLIGSRALVAGIIGASLLIFIAVASNAKTRLPAPLRNVLEELGNASYMIYLIQIFTLPLAGHLMPSDLAHAYPTLLGLFTVVLTIACGWLAYAFAETRVLTLVRGPGLAAAKK
jgi:peptidoglycan/LPS O-acetylase OafA/YrhL